MSDYADRYIDCVEGRTETTQRYNTCTQRLALLQRRMTMLQRELQDTQDSLDEASREVYQLRAMPLTDRLSRDVRDVGTVLHRSMWYRSSDEDTDEE